MKIFVVYDSAAEAHGTPFFLRSTGEAVRSFTQAAHDAQTLVSKYPEQFTLFEIGTYDEISGQIEMFPVHKSLGKALEYISTSNNQHASGV